MKRSRISLYTIIILTFVAIFLNVPRVFQINFKTPKLPIINKSIGFDKPIKGSNPIYRLGPISSWNLKFRKGLDLEGGTSITLKADMKDVSEKSRDDALESAKGVIERRINFFGVSEPVIQTAKVNNDYRIIVEIPGVTDVNEAIKLIGTTAKLTFWEEGASTSARLTPASASAEMPFGIIQLLGENAKPTNLSGSDLQQTEVSFDPNSGKPQIDLVFDSDGAKKFSELTARNVGKILAIVLDNQVI